MQSPHTNLSYFKGEGTSLVLSAVYDRLKFSFCTLSILCYSLFELFRDSKLVENCANIRQKTGYYCLVFLNYRLLFYC